MYPRGGPAFMSYLLIAVMSHCVGVVKCIADNSVGYQSSVMQAFHTLDDCEAAGRQFLEVYKLGNASQGEPNRGHIRCLDLANKTFKVVYSK
jgi:hypothetical protein